VPPVYSDVYALVREIREKRFPRNRYFDEHATPGGAEARRLHRFLRAVEKDLLEAEAVEVARDTANDIWRVTMRFPSVRLSRVVALSSDEHAILIEDARLRQLLETRD
jgi:hypothetical protein